MKIVKAFIGLCIYGLTLFIISVLAISWWGVREFEQSGPLTTNTEFTIERGMGLGSIALGLEDHNIISNRFVFMAGAKMQRLQSSIKAGEYAFQPGMSARNVLDQVVAGNVISRRFTVPEGLTSYEVVNIVNTIDSLEGEITTIPPEGSLLPGTWDYRRGQSRQAVLKRMQESMNQTLDALWANRSDNLPFQTKTELLTLASIIEKETGKSEERSIVAGVFINRLRKKMLLQTDPTVIYALTKGRPQNDGKGPLGRRLLRKDLSYDSPYNTYVYSGLPPGPIANPGHASIAAALNPTEHDYLYFVADGTGGHAFARTLAEHNRNVARWRQIRKK